MLVQIRKKGTLTLPVEIRTRYGLNEGDVLSIIDLGDGTLMITPKISRVQQSGRRIAEMMTEEGISEEALIQSLEQEREQYYRENCGED